MNKDIAEEGQFLESNFGQFFNVNIPSSGAQNTAAGVRLSGWKRCDVSLHFADRPPPLPLRSYVLRLLYGLFSHQYDWKISSV